MGSDASAAIIYGFPYEGEGFEYNSCANHDDHEEWLAEFQGLLKPADDADDKEWQKYWDAQAELPLETECEGCMMSGTTTTYLCIRESILSGDWDRGTEIPAGHIKMPPPPEWDALLKTFCEKSGVPFVQPKWWIIASYG